MVAPWLQAERINSGAERLFEAVVCYVHDFAPCVVIFFSHGLSPGYGQLYASL
jgi:hypothetical protein